MKKVWAFLAFMVWTLHASATDGITIANVSIPQGGEAIATVNLESVTSKYGGFQFDLQLPAGISAAAIVQANRLKAIAGYTLTLSLSNPDNNTYTILGYNMSHTEIAGDDGAVAYIALRAGTGAAAGTANIAEVVLAQVSGDDVSGAELNSSFTITLDAALTEVELSEDATTAPAASNGAVNVTVNRKINANEWSTICLPFDMSEAQVKSTFGEGVQLKQFSSWSFEGTAPNVDKITVGFSPVTSTTAHKPYIINISKAITSFVVYNAIITTTNKTMKKSVLCDTDEDYTGIFTGSYVNGTVANNDVFLSGNKFWYSTGSTNIKAFRATFNFDEIVLSNPSASSRITMSFDEPSSETTGIKNVKVVRSDKVYNLSGQQVKNPARGIYVKEGKKVIIK